MSEKETTDLIAPPDMRRTDVARRGFGGTEMQTVNETAATAMAERAKAEVQARFMMALHSPRNIEASRQRMLIHCERPGFAAQARYRRPVGKKKNEETDQWEDTFIEGPSVRFVEMALAEYGNNDTSAVAVYDDDFERHLRVTVIDLETNVAHHDTVVVTKTVERRTLKRGQIPIRTRVNSYGDSLFVVEASDDEVLTKQNALVSKARRNLGLRILPRDIVDESQDVCIATIRAGIAQDIVAARRQVLDGFGKLGIEVEEVERYLGHPVSQVTPPQIEDLRAIWVAVKDGDAKWRDLVEMAQVARGEIEASEQQVKAASKLRGVLEKKSEKRAEAAAKAEAAKKGPPRGAAGEEPQS